jgi:hypothetical protein
MGSAGSSILIPHADIATWATGNMASQLFFLYTAIDPQEASIDVSAQYANVEFSYKVLNSSNVVIANFSLKHGESKTFTELPAGVYTVIKDVVIPLTYIVNVVTGNETLVVSDSPSYSIAMYDIY